MRMVETVTVRSGLINQRCVTVGTEIAVGCTITWWYYPQLGQVRRLYKLGDEYTKPEKVRKMQYLIETAVELRK